jgi:hypothetical protein
MERNFVARGCAALLMVGLFSICAEASPIVGLVTTDGSATVNLHNFLFASTTGAPGVFTDSVPTTGSFTGLAGDNGAITNLNDAVETIGGLSGTVQFNDPNWMVFSGPPNANISFDLQQVSQGDFTSTNCGAFPPVAGQTCSLPGSPFDLTNDGTPGGTVTGVTISIAVSGTAINTSTGETSAFTGIINNSGQLIDLNTGGQLNTLQQVVSAVEAGDNINSAYVGAFSAVSTGVPEPSTIVLGSLGALFLAVGSIRRRKRV